jgi:transposase, IS5 family
MLRDRVASVDVFALVPALQLRFEPELAELDRLLEDDQIFVQVKADLSRRRPHTTETGRPSTPVEVILRLLVVQHLYDWSYAQTEHFVGDSLVLRQFCRLGFQPVPHHTTLMRWSNLLQPETMHRLLDRVTELARSLKVTRGRKLRIDSTVVATAIHYPTDSTLLFDGVRVLGRLVRQAATALSGSARRLGLRRTRLAKQLVRRIEATAAVAASATTRAERPKLYRRLLAVAQASIHQAHQVQRWLTGWSDDATAQHLKAALQHTAPLVQQVIAQAERRVLYAENVPASDKLVSLFEPHTAIVRRGKAHLPAEFGRKIVLDEVDGGLVTRYAVLTGNPPDAPELPASLDHHQARFNRPPEVLTADRAFFTLANQQLAEDLHIGSIALPRQGSDTTDYTAARRRAFRRAYRWRAGIEGRISVLKRRFGLDRCRYHGEAGMERWVGWGLLADNLREISHSIVAESAR